MDMRLFTKVKPGTAFVADTQNSGKQVSRPEAADTAFKEQEDELQASKPALLA